VTGQTTETLTSFGIQSGEIREACGTMNACFVHNFLTNRIYHVVNVDNRRWCGNLCGANEECGTVQIRVWVACKGTLDMFVQCQAQWLRRISEGLGEIGKFR
jgi:hypothetical protein